MKIKKPNQDDKILDILSDSKAKLTPRQIWFKFGQRHGLSEYSKRPYIQITSVRRSLNTLMKSNKVIECGKTEYLCKIENFKTTETLYSLVTKEVKQLELW
jgi:hypothetical protein